MLTIDEAEDLLLAGEDVQILPDGTLTRGKAPGCSPSPQKTVADWECEELRRMGVPELRAALELNCARFHNMFDVAEAQRFERDRALETLRLQHRWLVRMGYLVRAENIRKRHPELTKEIDNDTGT